MRNEHKGHRLSSKKGRTQRKRRLRRQEAQYLAAKVVIFTNATMPTKRQRIAKPNKQGKVQKALLVKELYPEQSNGV